MTSQDTFALVESPAQLLNAAEWAYACGETHRLRVAVLRPRDPAALRQIARVAGLVAFLGVEVQSYPVHERSAGAAFGALRVMRQVANASRLVIGNPFSRFVQSVLPSAGADEVVVVRGGTSMWGFAESVNAAQPLVHWRRAAARPHARADRACRLLSPGPNRRLTVFSCLNDVVPVGATGLANRYEWTRSVCRPDVRPDEIDVIGTAFFDAGIVGRSAYLSEVAELAERHVRMRYIPHPRESEDLVAAVGSLPGVRVEKFDLPVELALRHGPVAHRIVSFPSSAAHTLPVVLGGSGVRFETQAVEASWFTPGTSRYLRDYVTCVAATAPVDRSLELV